MTGLWTSRRRCATEAGEPYGRERHRARCLVLLLLACYVALPLLALASPPDAVWIPGIYDLADYDDVVVAITDVDSVDHSSPVPFLLVDDVWVRVRPGVPRSVLSNSSLLPYQPRSPPAV